MTDIEFLELMEPKHRHTLYIYRGGSALLRKAVRDKVLEHAAREGISLRDIATYSQNVEKAENPRADSNRGSNEGIQREDATTSAVSDAVSSVESVMLPSLHLTVSEVSLFEQSLALVDLGDQEMKKLRLEDIEQALYLIAGDGAEQSLCLMVPSTHPIIDQAAWIAATNAVAVIAESEVTLQNYLAVTRSYLPRSRLGDLQHLSNDRKFLTQLRKFVEKKTCDPFALSLEVDLIVLGEMENREFLQLDENVAIRGERIVLPETLRRFLDDRDGASLASLMNVIDRLRHGRMLESREILTRIYRATTATLQSQDKRYRRLEDPAHCVWAALLLSNERKFLNAEIFVSMDFVCQEYARMTVVPDWFSSDTGWRAIAPLLAVDIDGSRAGERMSRLDRARADLRNALVLRLSRAQSDDLIWFQSTGIEAMDRGAPVVPVEERRAIGVAP
jgi:hypothetical protein